MSSVCHPLKALSAKDEYRDSSAALFLEVPSRVKRNFCRGDVDANYTAELFFSLC